METIQETQRQTATELGKRRCIASWSKNPSRFSFLRSSFLFSTIMFDNIIIIIANFPKSGLPVPS